MSGNRFLTFSSLGIEDEGREERRKDAVVVVRYPVRVVQDWMEKCIIRLLARMHQRYYYCTYQTSASPAIN